MRRLHLVIYLLLLSAVPSFSQNVKGRVLDKSTAKPMPFVNIRFDKSKRGTASDIDGFFTLDAAKADSLTFSFAGYRDTTVAVSGKAKYFVVRMQRRAIKLQEVKIFPGVNPAHRIIKTVVANRKKNNPEKLNSFSYTAYNKMIFTADPNALLLNDSLASDSAQKSINDFLEKHHLFLTESVSKRYFRKGKSYEKIIASRASGFRDPFFVMIATQFQSFSFYNPVFSLLDKNYINPISPGSTKKYFFLLQDTVFQGTDTVFIISFRPLKGKNFDGLKGLLYINTSGYAVQNVIAEPYDSGQSIGIKIRQQYKKYAGDIWFPSQLNTTLTFNTVELNDMPMVGYGTAYIDSVKINTLVPKKIRRKAVVMEIDKEATSKSSDFWEKYRSDTLDTREKNTYVFIDSLGQVYNLDRRIKNYLTLAAGGLPAGIFTIPFDKILAFNSYEKFRLGLGIKTNERLSPYFSLSAYGAYGTGDKKWKYGASLEITPVPSSEFLVKFAYKNDLEESAAQTSFQPKSVFSSENYREFLINKMNSTEDLSTSVRFRALKYFLWDAGYFHSRKSVNNNYLFQLAGNGDVTVSSNDFIFSGFYAGFRFAYGEKIVRNRIKSVSLGTKFPVLHFRWTAGLQTLGSDFRYNRLDFQLYKSFYIRYLGKSTLRLSAGFIDTPLPWYQLYNGKGSYLGFYLFTPSSFGTMRINEFLSDRFLSLFWEHNFGKLLFNYKYFSPDIALENNFGIGNLSSAFRHKNLAFNTMEKGYFESGLMLKGLLRSGLANIGFGVFYRYGPYALPRIKDNIAYKLAVEWSLGN